MAAGLIVFPNEGPQINKSEELRAEERDAPRGQLDPAQDNQPRVVVLVLKLLW